MYLMMGLQKGDAAMIMRSLQEEVMDDRDDVGIHVDQVVNTVFAPPVPVTICWSNKVFMDSRTAWEMTRELLKNGPLSGMTALEHAGEDPEQERERKQEEWELADDEKTMGKVLPVYDAAHGNKPGEEPGERGGRPAGKTSKARGV
jgi:hypothetical protein